MRRGFFAGVTRLAWVLEYYNCRHLRRTPQDDFVLIAEGERGGLFASSGVPPISTGGYLLLTLQSSVTPVVVVGEAIVLHSIARPPTLVWRKIFS